MEAEVSIEPGEADRQRLAALRRVKALAAAALALCLAVFVAAKAFESSVPVLGFVAAFAEAAAIGGIADWYAVVALFRRPLGLPIPHTAIIPSNKDRIAENLGRFIEVNFLAEAPVRRKLEEVDFAALVADWLSDRRRVAGLSGVVLRLAPQTLAAIENSGLRDFASERVTDQLGRVKIAPLAAEFLTTLTENRRHQQLFDEILAGLGNFLNDADSLASMRDRIRDELPTLFKAFRADAYLLKKIVASASGLLDEIKADADHPMRLEFDRFVIGFIEQLRSSPVYARRAEQMKRDLLARPEIRDLAADLWNSFRTFVEKDAKSAKSRIRPHLDTMFVELGRHLATEEKIRADMNQGFVTALAAFVEKQKGGVSNFIADQVKGWDLGQLTRLIEINVGRDLQYIRFNGMIIGGFAGLGLYVIERAVSGN